VAELPAALVFPRSVRVCGVGCVRRRGEPRTASRGPQPLFIALCDGGPPTMDWLGAPDQGAVSSPLRPLGRNGEEIELTESARRVSRGRRGRRIWDSQARAHGFERRRRSSGDRVGALVGGWLVEQLARAIAHQELACVGAPAGGPLVGEHPRRPSRRGTRPSLWAFGLPDPIGSGSSGNEKFG
jgi:hypothetical protein